MRKIDLYWKSNRDWWFYGENFIPRLKVTAPLEAQKSYVRYRRQKGCTICNVCPRMQEFVVIDKCLCGADLKMNVRTHIAICDICGSESAVPLAVVGFCYYDETYSRYDFTFSGELPKETILAASKILGTNAVQLYKAIKDHTPFMQNLTYTESRNLKNILLPLGISFTISPELIEYEKYETCRK